MKVVALSLNKIAGDLRLLGSGPNGGLGGDHAARASGRKFDHARQGQPGDPRDGAAGRGAGRRATTRRSRLQRRMSTLQINTAMPIMARSVLSSIHLLANAATLLDTRCIRGVEVDADRMRRNAERSPAIVTALAPRIGYDAASEAGAPGRGAGRVARRTDRAASRRRADAASIVDALLAMTRPHD